jgi:ribonuclease HI
MDLPLSTMVEAPKDPDSAGRRTATRSHNQIQENPDNVLIYTDGSGFKGGVGASAVWKDIAYRMHLGTTEEATVFAAELQGIRGALTMIETMQELRVNTITRNFHIFTDNQAAIDATHKGYTESGQEILRQIISTMDRVHTHTESETTIHWIPAHTGVPGNESADEAAKKAAEGDTFARGDLGSPPSKTLAAVRTKANQAWQKEWKDTWEKSSKGRHSFMFTREPTVKTLELHAKLAKPRSSIGIQLRTGKIGLGEFLYGRRVPGFETPRCSCNQGNQTVQHVLLTCRRWAREREEAFGNLRHRNILRILGEPEPLLLAINMILDTGLLGQFVRAREMLAEIEEA